MKTSIASGLLLSLFQSFVTAAVLLLGIDSPIIVAAATLAIVGPMTYLVERGKKSRHKTRMAAWQASVVTTIMSALLAMYLSARETNHYFSVFYAACFAMGVSRFGIAHITDRILKNVAQGMVDVFKRFGWIDDE